MHCRPVVEHIFGAQANDMGGTLVRTIGLVRAKAQIGMKTLANNMRRLGQQGRINPHPARKTVDYRRRSPCAQTNIAPKSAEHSQPWHHHPIADGPSRAYGGIYQFMARKQSKIEVPFNLRSIE